MARKKDSIVLHHSLTKDGDTVSWQAIRHYHTEVLGWRDVGYQFGIEWVKDFGHIPGHFEVLKGRGLLDTAAAVKEANMNSRGIHICFVGNYDITEPQWEMVQVGVKLVAELCSTLTISPNNIFGHSDFADYKTCPGEKFPVELLRQRVTLLLENQSDLLEPN